MEYEIAAKTLFTVSSYENEIFVYPNNNRFLVEDEEQKCAADYSPNVQPSSSKEDDTEDGSKTPARQMKPRSLMRVTMDPIHDPADSQKGFVFGSDEHKCDVLLDKSQARGVSRKQFAILLDWDTRTLTLENMSSQGTDIESRTFGDFHLEETLKLHENEIVNFRLGQFDIEIRIPGHSSHRDIFFKNWAEYRARLLSKLPVLQKLALKSNTKTGATISDDYILGPRLGRGTQASVYSAKERKSGDECAIKRFHDVGRYNAREVAIASQLKHPHIIQTYSAHTYDNTPVVAMELGGPDLLQVMRDEPLSHTELQTGLKQLFGALAYLHNRNLTHRDIKPANIIVTSCSPICLKFTDFGLAKTSDDLKSFVGTPHYIAPECKLDGSFYTDKVDIWSMGIMALEFFYGPSERPPRGGPLKDPRWIVCVQKHLASQRPQNVTWSFISSLLQIDPERRPSAKQCLEHRFFNDLCDPIALSQDIIGEESTIPFDPPLQDDDTVVTGVKNPRKIVKTTNSPPRTVIHNPESHVSLSTIILNEARHSTRAVPSPSHHESASHELSTIIRVDESLPSTLACDSSHRLEESSHGSEESGRHLQHENPLSMSHWSSPAFPGSNNDRIGIIRTPHNVEDPAVIVSKVNKSRNYDSVTGSIVSTTSGPPATPTSYRRVDSNSSVATKDSQKFHSESRENHGALDDIPEDSVWYPWDPASVEIAPTPGKYESTPEDLVDVDGSREWPPTPGRVPDPEPEAISIQRVPTPGTSGMNFAIIGHQRVNVRMSDYTINATKICAAAGLDPKRSRKYLLPLKKVAAPPLQDQDLWVPFGKGIELCRTLRLDDNLEQQLSQFASLPQQDIIPSIEVDDEPIELESTRKRKRRGVHN
ncbi:kinase-like domain-containing protein [Xylaria curta]|nr:kinase-like domain-containing protein [Xylaria curta]